MTVQHTMSKLGNLLVQKLRYPSGNGPTIFFSESLTTDTGEEVNKGER